MSNPRLRRRLRTSLLGVVAFIALLWGAVDLVGVPPENLWRLLGEVSIGIALLIVLAAIAAVFLAWLKKRARDNA